MWSIINRLILRYKVAVIIALAMITGLMTYKATKVELAYEMAKLLPESDSTYMAYNDFRQRFGEDAKMILIGVEDTSLFQLENFNAWYDLTESISKIETNVGTSLNPQIINGAKNVLSLAKPYKMVKEGKDLELEKIFKKKPETQKELDSLLKIVHKQKFYRDFLYVKSDTSYITILAVTLKNELVNSEGRINFVEQLYNKTEEFSNATGIDVHYSGLPYIRTRTMQKISSELNLFIVLAAVILAIILFIIFRSFRAVLTSLLVVGISVIWVFGFMDIFGYEITILTGLIPPLIIVIGIPNCIFLLNKYHHEYFNHGNKIKAITRVIHKIGHVTLLTNVTTASGFATFILTKSTILIEFGVIASINILCLFLISLFIIPISLSIQSPPKARHIKHLDSNIMNWFIKWFVYTSINNRKTVYTIFIVFVISCFIGISMIKTSGNVVDDIPKHEKLYSDLMLFEKHFNGVLPFEISIDTKKPNGVFENNAQTIYKIKRLTNLLKRDTTFSKYFSRSFSINDGIMLAYQAHKGGKTKYYILPASNELNKLKKYVSKDVSNDHVTFSGFIDSTQQVTRVTVQMANISTNEIQALKDSLKPKVDEIFTVDMRFFKQELKSIINNDSSELALKIDEINSEDFEIAKNEAISLVSKESDTTRQKVQELIDKSGYDVDFTGTSVVFLKGTNFLIENLFISLAIAIFLISSFMAFMFSSFRMVLISLIPNIIPLLFTAAVMGYFGIHIKPSTILVFSIAFGISVDDTIHYLAKYRQELKISNGKIRFAVIMALKETGVSMMYTSVVLFFGFAIFIASSFGGTVSLGLLVSLTLMVAMITNLILLPCLLISLEKSIIRKALKTK